MIICGLDISPTSTGVTKFILDDSFNVIETKYLGFQKKKKIKDENIIPYDQFSNDYDRIEFIVPKIVDFCSDADFVAIESYAYSANGNITMIAEFTGAIKLELYKKGISIRFYDPLTIKFHATSMWKSTKYEVYTAYNALKSNRKIDISSLPEVTEKKVSGVSPTSDLIDSWYICDLLYTELQLRKGLVQLKDLPEEKILIFNRVTKSNPTNILATDFLKKNS